ncbi:MAG: hypothetical protein KGZ71_09860 [Desulfobulbaceae bacterium]|nr:hypothetical protein [Desulfobulbaceae bacterium]
MSKVQKKTATPRQNAFPVYISGALRSRLQEVKDFFLLTRDVHAASHCVKVGLEIFKTDPERFKKLVAM